MASQCSRTAVVATACFAMLQSSHAFTTSRTCSSSTASSSSTTTTSRLYLVPPPGSGYAGPEYEINEMPDSYEPMMEYPGTMRPGRTPENMPFHDLPIGDDDPDPVPWPHFQQIEVSCCCCCCSISVLYCVILLRDMFHLTNWFETKQPLFSNYLLPVAPPMGSASSSPNTHGRLY